MVYLYVNGNQLTSSIFWESKLSTHNSCFSVTPTSITDSLPFIIITHFYTFLEISLSSNQSNVILIAWYC